MAGAIRECSATAPDHRHHELVSGGLHVVDTEHHIHFFPFCRPPPFSYFRGRVNCIVLTLGAWESAWTQVPPKQQDNRVESRRSDYDIASQSNISQLYLTTRSTGSQVNRFSSAMPFTTRLSYIFATFSRFRSCPPTQFLFLVDLSRWSRPPQPNDTRHRHESWML
jgi:hypothetical protein